MGDPKKKSSVVTGGLGFVGAALCLELIRRRARQVRSFDLRDSSPWSDELKNIGVRCIQGYVTKKELADLELAEERDLNILLDLNIKSDNCG